MVPKQQNLPELWCTSDFRLLQATSGWGDRVSLPSLCYLTIVIIIIIIMIIIITIIIIITMITMSGHNLDMSWQKSSHMQQARVELLFY